MNFKCMGRGSRQHFYLGSHNLHKHASASLSLTFSLSLFLCVWLLLSVMPRRMLRLMHAYVSFRVSAPNCQLNRLSTQFAREKELDTHNTHITHAHTHTHTHTLRHVCERTAHVSTLLVISVSAQPLC